MPPDRGPNCLHKLSADDTSRQLVNTRFDSIQLNPKPFCYICLAWICPFFKNSASLGQLASEESTLFSALFVNDH